MSFSDFRALKDNFRMQFPARSKVYWIYYYLEGNHTRQRIDRSKLEAENRLREVQTTKAELRNIRKTKMPLQL